LPFTTRNGGTMPKRIESVLRCPKATSNILKRLLEKTATRKEGGNSEKITGRYVNAIRLGQRH